MNIFLSILCVILAIALAISLAYNLRLGRIIIDVEDALTEALDTCDQSYTKMATVAETPVAIDSPEVRQVLLEINRVRDAVLYVSNVLAEPYGGVQEEDVNVSKV